MRTLPPILTSGVAPVQALLDFFKVLGPARLAAMAVVTLALVGFFAWLILRVSQPTFAPLYTDLTLEDSAAVVRELERANIPFELRANGATIAVPQEQVTRLRMQMAGQGIPKGGGMGYELFDKTDQLGATSFVQNLNHLRALEGELSRTIRALDRVEHARVHLVLPERPLFSRDRVDPSASIVVRARGGLEAAQIRAIRHLVASAVQGLKPERISIVDEQGRLLADGAVGANAGSVAHDERQSALEQRLRRQVEEIVSSVVGPGRARVSVNAELDFNRVTQTLEAFDPEQRVVRSTQTREEQAQTSEGNNAVTVGNELPSAGQPAGGAGNRDQSRKTEEIVNYEISRTTRTEVVEGGRIKRLSVAVLVDGVYTRAANGDVAYEPRVQADLDRIAALVRSGVGFDQRRGDQIEVINLRFAEQPQALPQPTDWVADLFAFTRADMMRAIEWLVLLIVALIVIFAVVRPLVRRMLAEVEERKQADAAAAKAEEKRLLDKDAEGNPKLPEELESETAQMIEIAQVKGQIHAQSVQKIGELVEKNPHETALIIRQWLQEAA